jgi:GntR family transcriptional regulator, arabinose operon transcriptional repressor
MYTKRIYEQVRELIEADARDKKPGEPIDTEVGYARRFGVSRPTTRKAVEDLIRIGMIKRVAGKGLVMATQDETPYRGKLLIALPHEMGDGFLFRVALGCVEQANLLGFDYKLLNATDPKLRYEQVRRERIKDYIAVITSCYEEEYEYMLLSYLQDSGLPVLLIDNPPKKGNVPCVTCDDFDGGYQMGSYLARKGHTGIANLSSSRPVLTIERRDQGFLQALHDAGVDYDTTMMTKDSYDYLTDFIKRFTAQDFTSGRVTAICSHTSLAIVAVSQWLYQNGLQIYDDVSVIGYGDYPYIPMFQMPFTTIGVPSSEMGRSAVDEISEALLEKRPLKSIQHEVWLEKRHTVKTLKSEEGISEITA